MRVVTNEAASFGTECGTAFLGAKEFLGLSANRRVEHGPFSGIASCKLARGGGNNDVHVRHSGEMLDFAAMTAAFSLGAADGALVRAAIRTPNWSGV